MKTICYLSSKIFYVLCTRPIIYQTKLVIYTIYKIYYIIYILYVCNTHRTHPGLSIVRTVQTVNHRVPQLFIRRLTDKFLQPKNGILFVTSWLHHGHHRHYNTVDLLDLYTYTPDITNIIHTHQRLPIFEISQIYCLRQNIPITT
jgi:hypothetical protein